jgi:dTDP-4-dehydrorhamnose reductase
MANIAHCVARPDEARQVNIEATRTLVDLCAAARSRLVFVSTDLVFDGEAAPYREDAPPRPLSVYGQTKAEAESVVRAVPGNLVVRVSWLAGPRLAGTPRFFDDLVRALCEGRPFTLFTDEWRTPLGLPTAAEALLALADADVAGTLHLGGPERLSRYEMGVQLAAHLGAEPSLLRPSLRESNPAPEPRPRDVSLDSRHWRERFPQVKWRTYAETVAETVRG